MTSTGLHCRRCAALQRCSRTSSSSFSKSSLHKSELVSQQRWPQRQADRAFRGHPVNGIPQPAGVRCNAAPVAERPLKKPAPSSYVNSVAQSGPLHSSEVIVRAALDLKTHGWAVVPDVFTRAECEEYIDSVWGWLESLGTGTDALLSSFDSVNIMRPPAVATPGRDVRAEPPPSWWHVDQAPRKPGLECIQGLLNLSDVGPHAGTLQVREGTHAAHDRFWREVSAMPAADKQACGDFYVFQPEEYAHWDQFPTRVLRGHGSGSLFLWDSRTVHQNCPPSDPTIWRHVLYTCYQPAALATEADLAVKRRAYETYDVTTHWPAANVSVGAPPTEEERRKYTPPRTRDRVENDTILQLAGVKPYDAAAERRCRPLLEAPVHELQALLAGHELQRAEALAAQAEELAAAARHDQPAAGLAK